RMPLRHLRSPRTARSSMVTGRRISLQRHFLYPSVSRRLRCATYAWGWRRWAQATKTRLSSIVYASRGNTAWNNRRRCHTVSGGAFFPQTPLQVPEKKMGQHSEQHVVMPASIFPHFILRHPQLRFPFLTTLFHRPADATQPDQGAQGRARWGIPEIVGICTFHRI